MSLSLFRPSLVLIACTTIAACGSPSGSSENTTDGSANTPVQPSSLDTSEDGQAAAVDIAAGGEHSLAVLSDGTVWTWGLSGNGQLSRDVTIDDYWLPVQAEGNATGDIVAAGSAFSLVYGDGALWGAGYNHSGYLGWGPSADEMRFKDFAFPGVTDMDAWGAHVVTLMGDSTVMAWGEGTSGQIGNGTTPIHQVDPAQVSDLEQIIAVAAGGAFSVALRADGTVWAWGMNNNSTLGTSAINHIVRPTGNSSSASSSSSAQHTFSTVPVQVEIDDVIAVGAGQNHALAVKSDGTVWGWGWNESGALGQADYNEIFVEPFQIQGIADATAVTGGTGYSLVLKSDGTVMILGHLSGGSFDDNNHHARQLPNLRNITMIDAAQTHGLAISSNGTVWSFGANHQGQLGSHDADETQYEPVRVALPD